MINDVLNKLNEVMYKLDRSQHLDSFILCLKMISQILKDSQNDFILQTGKVSNENRFSGYGHDIVGMLDKCLNAIGPNVS